MKVAQLNRWDVVGGAAIAAYRQHRAIRSVGIDSVMYVGSKRSQDKTVKQMDFTNLSASDITHQKNVIHMEEEALSRNSGTVSGSLGPFSFPYSQVGPRMLAQMPKVDLINLHWICGFLPYEEFFIHQLSQVPIVWTLHDMNPFTGGCHFSGDCDHFTRRCGGCGYISSQVEHDMSRENFLLKEKAIARGKYPIHVVSPSKWLARQAQRSTFFSDAEIRVIPYSIDIEEFRPLSKRQQRERLQLPQDKVIGFFPSHNLSDPRKGIAYLEEALRMFDADDVENFVLLTVGQSNYEVNSKVKQLSLSFVSDRDILCQLFSAVDFTFLPSVEDNLPNVILESMSCGTPIIAFDTGGAADFIRNEETGWLVDKLDSRGFHLAIREAINTPQKVTCMGENSRKTAEVEFAPKIQGERYKALYEDILSNPGAKN